VAAFFVFLAERHRSFLLDYKRRDDAGTITKAEERLATLERLKYKWLLQMMQVCLLALLAPPVMTVPIYYFSLLPLDQVAPPFIATFVFGFVLFLSVVVHLARDELAMADKAFPLEAD